jgi:hypothetical protein
MENKTEARPDFVTDEHLEYLDDLRESGRTNMFGATAFLTNYFFDLSRDEAEKILFYWMRTFSQRHPSS